MVGDLESYRGACKTAEVWFFPCAGGPAENGMGAFFRRGVGSGLEDEIRESFFFSRLDEKLPGF